MSLDCFLQVPDKNHFSFDATKDDNLDPVKAIDINYREKKPNDPNRQISDYDKTDAILVEDSIYNLAFAPSTK
jgi:hypothetical protein